MAIKIASKNNLATTNLSVKLQNCLESLFHGNRATTQLANQQPQAVIILMADARQIGGYISTATGLVLRCSDFSPPWVLLQITIFTISTALTVFDTYTDWEVVLHFQEVSFNNPLLPRDDNWLRAWFLFAAFGTVLSVISIGHEGIVILYSMYKSCQRSCCKTHRKAYQHIQSSNDAIEPALNTRMETEPTSDETLATTPRDIDEEEGKEKDLDLATNTNDAMDIALNTRMETQPTSDETLTPLIATPTDEEDGSVAFTTISYASMGTGDEALTPLTPRHVQGAATPTDEEGGSVAFTTISYASMGTGDEALTPLTPRQGATTASRDMDEEEGKEKDVAGEITDPLKWCFRKGWNSTTRNEALGAIILWFQDVPMLTMSVLYAFSQTSCKTPEPRDASPILLNIGISATAAVIASCWRLIRSFVRFYFTVKIAGKIEPIKPKCLGDLFPTRPIKPPGKRLKKILPKSSESAYPPDTCAHQCLRTYYFGIIMQLAATSGALGVLFTIWLKYAIATSKTYDEYESLGIYRFSIGPDLLLFNISDIITPSNGSFVNLEQIPNIDPWDIYCLSEFEYREENFEIFFNVIEVIVVSPEGKFCDTRVVNSTNSFCYSYYTQGNFILYYASQNPITGDVNRFDDECTAVKDIFGYHAGPKVDLGINVGRHIDRAGFPQNNEPLVIYYPKLGEYVLFSEIVDKPSIISLPSVQFQNKTLNCSIQFSYSEPQGAVLYTYRGATYDENGNCFCSIINTLICRHVYSKNVMYGYLTEDSSVIPFTHCYGFSYEQITPKYILTFLHVCPC